jgi:thiol-disulfide isomerase/thioredoxin
MSPAGNPLARAEVRSTIAVVVLALAGVIALWPRDAPSEAPAERPTPGAVDITAPAPDDAALAPLRRQAALEPCPSPQPDAPPAVGPLAGVVVPCLGAPGTVDLGAALAGRTALLNVWASWCPSCREEMPVLAAYAAEPGAVPVIGVNVRDQPAAALSMLADSNVDFPSVTDPDGALQRALQAPPVIPLSFVVRPDGSVQLLPPAVFHTVEEVRQAVAEHLASGRTDR